MVWQYDMAVGYGSMVWDCMSNTFLARRQIVYVPLPTFYGHLAYKNFIHSPTSHAGSLVLLLLILRALLSIVTVIKE